MGTQIYLRDSGYVRHFIEVKPKSLPTWLKWTQEKGWFFPMKRYDLRQTIWSGVGVIFIHMTEAASVVSSPLWSLQEREKMWEKTSFFFFNNLTWIFHIYHFYSSPNAQHHMTILIFKGIISSGDAIHWAKTQEFYYKSENDKWLLGDN